MKLYQGIVVLVLSLCVYPKILSYFPSMFHCAIPTLPVVTYIKLRVHNINGPSTIPPLHSSLLSTILVDIQNFCSCNMRTWYSNLDKTLLIITTTKQHVYNFFQVKSRVVHTKYGRIQGFGARVGRDAQQQRYVEVFLGIPYASPPVGNSR